MRPNLYARGDHVRPRIVQATVGEPRIPWIDPCGEHQKNSIYESEPLTASIETNIERFYMEPIRKSLRRRFSNDIHVCFVSDEEYADFVGGHVTRRRPLRNTGKFTFDSFVVGDSNMVAYNAAQAVAAGFDEYCNPLVIYGNPGLGKTHLLNAIAFAVSASEPDAQVVCIKGDEFTNELVGAIRDDTNAQFRDKYRNASVFLMDDVQFIAGKKQTQEEFFNTFDALYQNGSSIVITMDRPPRELKKLEERIRMEEDAS